MFMRLEHLRKPTPLQNSTKTHFKFPREFVVVFPCESICKEKSRQPQYKTAIFYCREQ